MCGALCVLDRRLHVTLNVRGDAAAGAALEFELVGAAATSVLGSCCMLIEAARLTGAAPLQLARATCSLVFGSGLLLLQTAGLAAPARAAATALRSSNPAVLEHPALVAAAGQMEALKTVVQLLVDLQHVAACRLFAQLACKQEVLARWLQAAAKAVLLNPAFDPQAIPGRPRTREWCPGVVHHCNIAACALPAFRQRATHYPHASPLVCFHLIFPAASRKVDEAGCAAVQHATCSPWGALQNNLPPSSSGPPLVCCIEVQRRQTARLPRSLRPCCSHPMRNVMLLCSTLATLVDPHVTALAPCEQLLARSHSLAPVLEDLLLDQALPKAADLALAAAAMPAVAEERPAGASRIAAGAAAAQDGRRVVGDDAVWLLNLRACACPAPGLCPARGPRICCAARVRCCVCSCARRGQAVF